MNVRHLKFKLVGCRPLFHWTKFYCTATALQVCFTSTIGHIARPWHDLTDPKISKNHHIQKTVLPFLHNSSSSLSFGFWKDGEMLRVSSWQQWRLYGVTACTKRKKLPLSSQAGHIRFDMQPSQQPSVEKRIMPILFKDNCKVNWI